MSKDTAKMMYAIFIAVLLNLFNVFLGFELTVVLGLILLIVK